MNKVSTILWLAARHPLVLAGLAAFLPLLVLRIARRPFDVSHLVIPLAVGLAILLFGWLIVAVRLALRQPSTEWAEPPEGLRPLCFFSSLGLSAALTLGFYGNTDLSGRTLLTLGGDELWRGWLQGAAAWNITLVIYHLWMLPARPKPPKLVRFVLIASTSAALIVFLWHDDAALGMSLGAAAVALMFCLLDGGLIFSDDAQDKEKAKNTFAYADLPILLAFLVLALQSWQRADPNDAVWKAFVGGAVAFQLLLSKAVFVSIEALALARSDAQVVPPETGPAPSGSPAEGRAAEPPTARSREEQDNTDGEQPESGQHRDSAEPSQEKNQEQSAAKPDGQAKGAAAGGSKN